MGVLDTELYSLMAVMAIVTTAMTGPALRPLGPCQTVSTDGSPLLASRSRRDSQ